jgi:hypothetical protein
MGGSSIMGRSVILVLAAATALAAGCGREHTDCGAVGARALELMRTQIASEPDDSVQHEMESMLGPLKEGVIEKCKASGWSEADRRCFLAADSMAAADACAAAADAPPAKPENRGSGHDDS